MKDGYKFKEELIKCRKVISHPHNKRIHLRTITHYLFLFLKKWEEKEKEVKELLIHYEKKAKAYV